MACCAPRDWRVSLISASNRSLPSDSSSDLQVFLIHLRQDVREQWRAQVALAGVGKHAEDRRSLGRAGSELETRGKGSPRGNADKNPFLLRELPARLHRLRPRNRDDAVDELHLQRVPSELRNEVGAPALNRMWLPRGMPRRR